MNGRYEGRLVKMFTEPGDPTIDVCAKCTGKQKNAPMLGLVIVKDMKRDGLKYEDGSILDPRDGTVYHALMELSPDGQKLSVRGYLGIPLLGQTQVWTRLPDNAMTPADIPKESVSPNPKMAGSDYDPRRPPQGAAALPTKRRSERAAAIAAMHDAIVPQKTRAALTGAGQGGAEKRVLQPDDRRVVQDVETERVIGKRRQKRPAAGPSRSAGKPPERRPRCTRPASA